MNARLIALFAVIAGFGVLTAIALMDAGYFGVLSSPLASWSGIQIFTDFVILAILACGWMIADARERGLTAWPFILITFFLGSFGPLFYLVVREWRAGARRTASA